MISVIIPVRDDERVLRDNESALMRLRPLSELIFVDMGSSDRTVVSSANLGKVLTGTADRGPSMNLGAERSENDVLLFMHPDNVIRPEALSAIEEAVAKNHLAGGCLRQRIPQRGLSFRLIDLFCNTRARATRAFSLDQGIFVRKNTFTKVKGFPDVPFVEDLLFSKRLRSAGRTAVLGVEISVPPGKFEAKGVFRTITMYFLRGLLISFRFPPQKLPRFLKKLR